MASLAAAEFLVTVPDTTVDERLDRTSVAGRPEVQYHAVDDTSFGATALTPAAAGTENATVEALLFEAMWAARVPPTSAVTMTVQITRRLARSPKELITVAPSG
jgi:hypothetical protein